MRQDFSISLKNCFSALDEQDTDIEGHWQNIKVTYHQSGKEVLGFRKKEEKDWLSKETWQAIDERKKQKAKILGCRSERIKAQQIERYAQANREVKRSARRDKRRYSWQKRKWS